MPVERINIVLEQSNDVDERGMDGPSASPAGVFLQIALASWNRKTRERGLSSALMFAHRDDGAAVWLANPDMMTTEQRQALM